jgi:hypothetical protein
LPDGLLGQYALGMARVYTKEETDAILRRAIDLQRGDVTTHDDLVAAAGEVGVPPEAIERAVAEVLAKRRDGEDIAAVRARAWRGFYAHLVPYLMVSALLGFINFMTGSFPWVLIVMLAWGIGLGSHLLAVALPDRQRLLRRVERQRERSERRGATRARVDPGLAVQARVRAEKPRSAEDAPEAQGEEPYGEEREETDDALRARRGPR